MGRFRGFMGGGYQLSTISLGVNGDNDDDDDDGSGGGDVPGP